MSLFDSRPPPTYVTKIDQAVFLVRLQRKLHLILLLTIVVGCDMGWYHCFLYFLVDETPWSLENFQKIVL